MLWNIFMLCGAAFLIWKGSRGILDKRIRGNFGREYNGGAAVFLGAVTGLVGALLGILAALEIVTGS